VDDTEKRHISEAIVKAAQAQEKGLAATADNFKIVYNDLGHALGVDPTKIKGSWTYKAGLVGNRRTELHRQVKDRLNDSPHELLMLVVPPDVESGARTDIEKYAQQWAQITRRLVLATSTVKPTTIADVVIVEQYDFPNATPAPWRPARAPSNHVPPSWFGDLLEALQAYKNVLIEGVPGTGKTHVVRLINEIHPGRSLGASGDAWAAMTLHPSVSYEDFIEGLRPTSGVPQTLQNDFEATSPIAVDRDDLTWFFTQPTCTGEFRVVDGFFLRVCARAAADPQRDFIVLLDELNRANVPKILGDLLTTLEASRRAKWDPDAERWDTRDAQLVTLPYSSRTLFVPENIYIIATVNGTDRSLAPLDDAVRRRFASLRAEPLSLDTLRAKLPDELSASISLWTDLNGIVLRTALGPNGVLGHSYFFQMAAPSTDITAAIRLGWRYAVLAQVCSLAERTGSEDLFAGSDESRRGWVSQRGVVGDIDGIITTLTQLDNFLADLGFQLTVEGTGLDRRLAVVEHDG